MGRGGLSVLLGFAEWHPPFNAFEPDAFSQQFRIQLQSFTSLRFIHKNSRWVEFTEFFPQRLFSLRREQHPKPKAYERNQKIYLKKSPGRLNRPGFYGF
jgi:hypothetical protein